MREGIHTSLPTEACSVRLDHRRETHVLFEGAAPIMLLRVGLLAHPERHRDLCQRAWVRLADEEHTLVEVPLWAVPESSYYLALPIRPQGRTRLTLFVERPSGWRAWLRALWRFVRPRTVWVQGVLEGVEFR